MLSSSNRCVAAKWLRVDVKVATQREINAERKKVVERRRNGIRLKIGRLQVDCERAKDAIQYIRQLNVCAFYQMRKYTYLQCILRSTIENRVDEQIDIYICIFTFVLSRPLHFACERMIKSNGIRETQTRNKKRSKVISRLNRRDGKRIYMCDSIEFFVEFQVFHILSAIEKAKHNTQISQFHLIFAMRCCCFALCYSVARAILRAKKHFSSSFFCGTNHTVCAHCASIFKYIFHFDEMRVFCQFAVLLTERRKKTAKYAACVCVCGCVRNMVGMDDRRTERTRKRSFADERNFD